MRVSRDIAEAAARIKAGSELWADVVKRTSMRAD
jgi:hypothetical protein